MAHVSWFLLMPQENTESKNWSRRDSVRRCEDARSAAKPVRRHTAYNETLRASTASVSTFRSHVRRWRTFVGFQGSPLLPSKPDRTWNCPCNFSSGKRPEGEHASSVAQVSDRSESLNLRVKSNLAYRLVQVLDERSCAYNRRHVSFVPSLE